MAKEQKGRLVAVVLAGGEGTRMELDRIRMEYAGLPKSLLPELDEQGRTPLLALYLCLAPMARFTVWIEPRRRTLFQRYLEAHPFIDARILAEDDDNRGTGAFGSALATLIREGELSTPFAVLLLDGNRLAVAAEDVLPCVARLNRKRPQYSFTRTITEEELKEEASRATTTGARLCYDRVDDKGRLILRGPHAVEGGILEAKTLLTGMHLFDGEDFIARTKKDHGDRSIGEVLHRHYANVFRAEPERHYRSGLKYRSDLESFRASTKAFYGPLFHERLYGTSLARGLGALATRNWLEPDR